MASVVTKRSDRFGGAKAKLERKRVVRKPPVGDAPWPVQTPPALDAKLRSGTTSTGYAVGSELSQPNAHYPKLDTATTPPSAPSPIDILLFEMRNAFREGRLADAVAAAVVAAPYCHAPIAPREATESE